MHNCVYLASSVGNTFYYQFISRAVARRANFDQILPASQVDEARYQMHANRSAWYNRVELNPCLKMNWIVDILNCNMQCSLEFMTRKFMMFPVHVDGNHWTLGVINVEEKKIWLN